MPAAVRAVAAGRDVRPVWLNVLGGVTFEMDDVDAGRSFVKFAPAGSGLPLAREAERLAWAQRFTPVPRVLNAGRDETGTWLHTAALPGRNAVDAALAGRPGAGGRRRSAAGCARCTTRCRSRNARSAGWRRTGSRRPANGPRPA